MRNSFKRNLPAAAGVTAIRALALLLAGALAAGAWTALAVAAADEKSPAVNPQSAIRHPQSEERVRELYVPFEDLSVLLESKTQRVLLPRNEYEDLLARAKKTADSRAPAAALIASAEYAVACGPERAELAGALAVSVLEDGLHAVGLDLAGVGLRSAALDGKGAPIGLADDGRLVLFVQGKGEHKLTLQMVSPLQTTAATQVLAFRLPAPPASRLALTVPGDVEVRSGAAVARRTFDEAAGETRFELLLPRGDVSLVMSLNSRLRRQDRVVVARSVLVDEVTQGYERLHATVSLAVLHQASDRFRFALPDGFEVTGVESPMLARWGVDTAGQRILEVRLREETTERVVLSISAVRTSPALEAWSFPHLEPLDVAGHVAVVGLLLEDRLKAEAVAPEGLIPIDTGVLAAALPQTVLAAEQGAARIRPVVAYYAPQGSFGLAARFVKPPARVLVTTNLLLVLEDGGQSVRGGFAMVPEAERLFGFDFSVPAGWDVTSVTTDKGEALAFERYAAAAGAAAGAPAVAPGLPADVAKAGRIHVRLAGGAAAGEERRVFFTAVRYPPDWLSDWAAASIEFPVFAMAGAARDVGAVAACARDDMTVRPESLERLTPLDENEKPRYGLAGVEAALAYRYEGQPYQARLAVERKCPRATARTWSFLRVDRDALAAHYELAYDVTEARVRRLAFLLPKETPVSLTVRGLDGVALKEYTSELAGEAGGEKRRWTAVLADGRKGTVRLAVDFEMRLPAAELKDFALPVVAADGVAYQSGLVSVEGSAELDVQVAGTLRKVDVGELAGAEYQPGRRLLGAFGFLGEPRALPISVSRHPQYGLPPAIVQRAELATVLSADGVAQTAARLLLRTKALFLEIRLPKGSTLWSATLDSRPTKPQREGQSLLVSLPAAGDSSGGAGAGGSAGNPAAGTPLRDLRVVYETPAGGLGFWSSVEAHAPRLLLRGGAGTQPQDVPLADLEWQVFLPSGYKVIRSEGSVATDELEAPELAAATAAGGLYVASGGVDFDNGAIGCVLGVFSAGSRALIKEVGGRREYPGDEVAAPEKSAEAPAERYFDADAERMERESLRAHATRPARTPAAVTAPAPAVVAAPAPPPAEQPPPGAKPEPDRPVPGRPEPPAKPPIEKRKAAWALEGVSSLTIDLERTGEAVTFRSLGAEPRLELVVANLDRLDSLAWGLALAVVVVGAALTMQHAGRKTAYVIGVALVATLAPVMTGRIELALVTNGMFVAACLLVPYYLAAAVVRGVVRRISRLIWPSAAAGAAALVLLAAVAAVPGVAGGAGEAAAAEPAMPPYVIQLAPPPEPVKVPEDALLLPYDPAAMGGIQGAQRVLVPYEKYVELWNLAYPDRPIGVRPPPAPYALAGASLAAALAGDEFVLFEGTLEIDVYADEYATIPLPLEGGVLAKADLDGKPARLAVVEAGPAASRLSKGAGPSADAAAPLPSVRGPGAAAAARPMPPVLPAPRSFVVLYASGKGRHRLDLAVRMRLEKRGGWRVAEGCLPAAPATALVLRVPQAGTEVRLGGVADRRSWETRAADETIRTALGAGGSLSLQWRPKVSEGQIDQTLTAQSAAEFDVQEDQLRLRWTVTLDFRHGERDFFSVEAPEGYIVEKVEGTNVRGWELKAAGGRQEITVSLLKRTKGKETFTVTLWRGGPADKALAFDVPVVGVVGAIRHSGRLVIRRSPLLDLRTESTTGVTRADIVPEPRAGGARAGPAASAARLPAAAPAAAPGVSAAAPGASAAAPGSSGAPASGPAASDESPLGIRPYQAYEFVAVPFVVRLAASPLAARTSAVVQTILRASEMERKLESRVVISVQGRPLYGARIVVPADLVLDRVQAPGATEWAAIDEGGRRVLTIHLGAGVEGDLAVLIQGKLGQDKAALALDLPRLEVLDVERQQGDLVVQADPAWEVRTEGLTNIERVLMQRVLGWLAEPQRALAQVALHYGQPDYAGRLVLAARKPDVSCFTVTNSRVTERAIEDAVLINWTVRNAGVREVSFLLPAWMTAARISVPLLRQKTLAPESAEPGARLRVRLELQDEVMDELKVLVEADRLLTEASHEAPIPEVETGRTDRRYVAVESAGRDETVIEKSAGLEPLSRQQKEWAAVAGLLRGGTTQAFIVAAGAEKPALRFRTTERKAVETAKGRIGLAQAVLVMDENGAYRAQQVYRLDNRTEQFLEIQLPQGAALWTAQVAGEPVKPVVLADAAGLPAEAARSAGAGQAAGKGRVR
ncbi:MAG: hypothetical protein FJ288_11270, partial [Planctomycetes bacterium]|nr:hypothetical protein [Planctomycetota bacterium]